MSVQVRKWRKGVIARAGQDSLGEGSKGEVGSLVILAPDDPRYGREEGRGAEDDPRVVGHRRAEALVGMLEMPSMTFIRQFVELRADRRC